jgi:hypothetical protein
MEMKTAAIRYHQQPDRDLWDATRSAVFPLLSWTSRFTDNLVWANDGYSNCAQSSSNIFNHPNFADPESNLNEGALFGQSIMMLGRSLGGLNPLYQIGGPRSTQLALRLQF